MILAIDTNCILPGQVGGIESYVISLVESLLAHADWLDRLVLVTRTENHELFGRYASERCEAALLPRPRFRGQEVSNWPALMATDPQLGHQLLTSFQQKKIALLRAHRVDLVHFPAGAMNPVDLDIPAVLTIHDLQHRRFPQYFSQAEIDNREKWWPISAQRASAIITDSQFVADDVARQFAIGREKLFVAVPTVQRQFLGCPPARILRDLRRRFDLPGAFLLYPAAAYPHKNHARLIRAFLAANVPGLQLVLTGAGRDHSDLPALITSLKADKHVRLLGRITGEELTGLYHLALGLIFPSEYEGCGQPVLEAMACACPVAASNVTSLPELLGDAAITFDPANEEDIALAIRRLAEDETLWSALASRARQRVGLFSPQRFVDALHLAYSAALEARRARPVAPVTLAA